MSYRTALRAGLTLGLVTVATLGSASAQSVTGEVLLDSRVGSATGGMGGALLDDGDFFGGAVTPIGDLDGDGITDVVVGAIRDDDGGTDRGAVWVLFMHSTGAVRNAKKISSTAGGLTGPLADGDEFGVSVASLGDLDGAGGSATAIAVGSFGNDTGGPDRGSVHILFLDTAGAVVGETLIGSGTGGFGGALDDGDRFGLSVAPMDGDRLAVGTVLDDDGAADAGAVWVLSLATDGSVLSQTKISAITGGFSGVLGSGDWFGSSVANIGDLDGDTIEDLAVGARRTDDGGDRRGAVWVLFMNADGTVDSESKISDTAGGFTGTLDDVDEFGVSVAALPDINDDGLPELAVGAAKDDDGGPNAGAVWVLFVDATGTVTGHQKISEDQGALESTIEDGDQFGYALCAMPADLYGMANLVVGARFADLGGADRGVLHFTRLSSGIWTDLDNALSGQEGIPVLGGTGTPTSGNLVGVNLTSAKKNTSAALAFGYDTEFLPLRDGLLVPQPRIVFWLPTGAPGSISVGALWPAGVPANFSMFFQYWIQDASNTKGFAVSNGLALTTP